MSKSRKWIHNIITIICIALILVSGYMIFQSLYPKYQEEKNFEEIQTIARSRGTDTIDWEALRAVNPDIVAWITIPGTHIDYPVVQTSDNDYYLTHNFNGEWSGYGTPFLDTIYDFNRDPAAQNAVVYAHSSRDGDQVGFEGLDKFEDEAYFKDHPYVYYTTVEDGNTPVQYEIVAVIKEDKDFDYRRPDFADQADFLNYYNNIFQASLYKTNKYIYSNDEIVTLSTCVFDVNDARVALIARRVSPATQLTTNNNARADRKADESMEVLTSPELMENAENI